MTFVFWFFACLFMLVALAIIVLPLLIRSKGKDVDREKLNIEIYKNKLSELDYDLKIGTLNQAEYDQAVNDYKRGLLADVDEQKDAGASPAGSHRFTMPLVVSSAIGVPLISILLYVYLGTPVSVVIAKRDAPRNQGMAAHEGMSPDQMVAAIKQQVEKNPADPKGWMMLARLYQYLKQTQLMEAVYQEGIKATNNNVELRAEYANYLTQMERPDEAVQNLQAIIKEIGETNATVLSHYADALASQSKSLSGKPYEVIKKALQIEPTHHKSLWLAGTAAFQEKDYKSALLYWENLMEMLDPNSPDAKMLSGSIGQVKSLLGDAGEQTAGVVETKADPKATVSGTVSLSNALMVKPNPTDTVYVFAKAAQGPPMPLAVQRVQVKDLPYQFTLDDSMAMNPALVLSKYKEVVITARVSKSGDALKKAGDIFGSSAVIKVGSKNTKVVIDQVVTAESGASMPMPAPSNNAQPQQLAMAGDGKSVSGTVLLSPTIAAQASPNDTLFVFAKAAQGPRMPLAVIRKQVKDLPLEFTIDDSMAMSPAAKLSDFSDVIITARVSKSGNAMQQSGDLTGASPVVKLGSQKLNIQINSVVP